MTTPFISRDDLSNYLGRDVTDDDGATIAVDSACDVVRTLTEQEFVISSATDTVYLDGTGTDSVFLPNRPVSDVSAVTVNGDAATDFAYTTEGRIVRTSEEYPDFSTWYDQPLSSWPEGRQNVGVTYTYGHGGTVPSAVRMVALALAHRMITQGGAVSEQIGDVRKTYAASSTDLTNGEKAILRKFRR